MQIIDVIAKPNGEFTYLGDDGGMVDLAFEPGSRRRQWVRVETPTRFVKLVLHTTGRLYAVDEAGGLWQRGADAIERLGVSDPNRPGDVGQTRVTATWQQIARPPQ